MEIKEFSISWGSLWRILAMLVFALMLFAAREILIAVFLAIVISSALSQPVTWLEKKRIPRIIGALAIYILGILAIAAVVYIVVPIFLVELNALLNNSSDLLGQLFHSAGDSSQKILGEINTGLNGIIKTLLGGEINFVALISRFLGGVLFTIVAFVLSFYLTVGRNGVEKFLITILPYSQQQKVLDIYKQTRKKIQFWFVSQLFLSTVVGVTVFLGLLLLGVKYSLIIGIVAGIFELVPYAGPILSGGLAVMIALSSSAALGIYTLILFIVIQQTESHILIPMILGYAISLNPVIVIISILLGAKVLGIVGAILAVPAAVMVQEILINWPRSKAPAAPAA